MKFARGWTLTPSMMMITIYDTLFCLTGAFPSYIYICIIRAYIYKKIQRSLPILYVIVRVYSVNQPVLQTYSLKTEISNVIIVIYLRLVDSLSQKRPKDHRGTPISYPNNTSVVLPSQPRFPLVEIINRHVGSMYSWDTVPVRCPGIMRKGTVEWRVCCSCLKS